MSEVAVNLELVDREMISGLNEDGHGVLEEVRVNVVVLLHKRVHLVAVEAVLYLLLDLRVLDVLVTLNYVFDFINNFAEGPFHERGGHLAVFQFSRDFDFVNFGEEISHLREGHIARL